MTVVSQSGFGPRSHVEFFEDAARDHAQDEHDDGPEGRDVDDVFAILYCVEDSGCDFRGLREESVLWQVRGHGCSDEPWLDREHMDTGAVDAIAHAIDENAEGAFGGSIHIVALAAPVSRHGRDDGESSLVRGLE